MSEKIDRREMLKGAAGLALFPTGANSTEVLKDAVSETVSSLENGLTRLHGQSVNPRDSGYAYHENVLQHYARGLEFPKDLATHEIKRRTRARLLHRIKIYPVSRDESALLRMECAAGLQDIEKNTPRGDVNAVMYISSDRKFQKIYMVRKKYDDRLEFVESYPMSTSAAEPKVPLLRDVHPSVQRPSPFTPLGSFIIPKDGVRPALMGEVTKVERPDLTRHYFVPLMIDGKTRYFVRDFGKTSANEIVTISGDTHLLWSPEIDGRGIKIHDTTEIDSIGEPVSSGCIRTPAVRRFTMLTSTNKNPTRVYIYWAKTKNISDRDGEGFGGSFGGEKKK